MPDRHHQSPIHRADLWKFKFVIDPNSHKVTEIHRRNRDKRIDAALFWECFKVVLVCGVGILGLVWIWFHGWGGQ